MMTILGWLSLVVFIILTIGMIVLLILLLAYGEDARFNTGPLAGYALFIVVIFLISGLITAVISSVFSILMIIAGKYMKKGKKRMFVTTIIILGSFFTLMSFIENGIELFKAPNFDIFGRSIVTIGLVCIWAYLLYALRQSWYTFEEDQEGEQVSK